MRHGTVGKEGDSVLGQGKSGRVEKAEEGTQGCKDPEAPACGCGAHLDIRDFGPNGKIDRNIYTLRVPVSEMEDALPILHALCPDYTPYRRDPNRKSLY